MLFREVEQKVKNHESQIEDIILHVSGGSAMQNHSHINKTTLDKFSVNPEGNLTFNNLPIEDKLTKEQVKILKSEIQNSRKDFNGITHINLSERLGSDMSYVNDRFNKATLVEYEDKYISANESFDGLTKDLKIKGRTIKNLLDDAGNCEDLSRWINAGMTLDNTVKLFGINSFKAVNGQFVIRDIVCDQTHKYLLSAYAYISSYASGEVSLNVYDYSSSTNKTSVIFDTTKLNQWQRKSLITTGKIGGGFRIIMPNSSSPIATVNIDGIMVYDLTEIYGVGKEPTDIAQLERELPYVDGIQSVGEGTNKIEVLSVGNNLFDLSKIVPTGGTVIVDGNKIFIKNTYASYSTCDLNKKLKPNTRYYISRKIEGTIPESGVTGRIAISSPKNNNILVLLSGGYNSPSSGYFTTPSDIRDYYSLIMYGNSVTTDIVFSDIVINEVETPYEPYKEDKINIQLTEPLRGLPNGTEDLVVFEDNKRIKKIAKYVLNGSEPWSDTSSIDNATHMRFSLNSVYTDSIGLKRGDVICDKFTNVATITTATSTDCISANTYLNYLYINIEKSKLTTKDVAGFRAWLQANPTTVYYELAVPVETPLDIQNSLRTYDKSTHLFTQGSLIEPNVYAKIPSDVVSLTDLRNSSVKGKIFANADARVEELEQDVKNIVTQEAWITPTLLNGWVDFGTPFHNASYYKDSIGLVRLRGMIKSGIVGQKLFILPVGCRPSASMYITAISSDTICTLSIDSVGNVLCGSNAKNNWLSLDNISFRV